MSRHDAHLSSYLKSKREKQLHSESRAPRSATNAIQAASLSQVKRDKKKSSHEKHKRNIDHLTPHEFSLPPELVTKIFSFLSPSEVLVCAMVCKGWNDISKEMSVWLPYYNRMPRSVRDSILPKERTSPTFQWKNEIIKRNILHRNKKVKSMLKKTSPYSGLPSGIEQCLKFLSIKWQLNVTDKDGNIHSLLNDDMFCFATSITVRWYTLQLPAIPRLKSLSVFALSAVFYHRDWKPHSDSATRKSLLISFDLKDLKISKATSTSEDEMITLHTVHPGVMFAIWKSSWKDGGELAFLSITLHHHQLMERILCGTRASMYRPVLHKPTFDDIDPFYGLQRYSATLELRNQRKLFWGSHYRELYQRSFNDDCLVLESHKEQEGMFNVKTALSWKTPVFKNIIHNMVIVDLTLMDEHKTPMWCVSSAVKVVKDPNKDVDYTLSEGESSQVEYEDNVGRLRINLVWIDDDRQNLVKKLEIELRKDIINKWFGTNY